jgi:hypothetical protein
VDEPLAMLRSSTTSYFQTDGLNSITSLSSTAGALAQTYSFDSFGNQNAASGSITNSFRYIGHEFNGETAPTAIALDTFKYDLFGRQTARRYVLPVLRPPLHETQDESIRQSVVDFVIAITSRCATVQQGPEGRLQQLQTKANKNREIR